MMMKLAAETSDAAIGSVTAVEAAEKSMVDT